MFLRAHQQLCCYAGETPFFWDMRVYLCCYWGSVSEWLPWALCRTRHRVSCSKQLWRNSYTRPMLQNIVYTSVILPTPWAHRETTSPPSLAFSTITTMLSHSLSALMSILFRSFSLTHSHHHVIPFFLLHKDIVKQIHPHNFSHWHPYTNTPRALKIHPCVKITQS